MYTLLQYNGVYDAFAKGLDKGLLASFDQRLERLALRGRNAGPKVSAPLRGGIFECRAQRKRQHPRALWFYMQGMKIVVAVCLVKEGKVPPAKIGRAIAIKRALEENPELLDGLTEIH